MRQPLTTEETLKWWLDAVKNKATGERTVIWMNEPQAGWFKRRFVRGGPWVGARIWWHQDVDDAGELLAEPELRCEVNGRPADALDQWTWLAGQPIEPEEFDRLMAPQIAAAPPDPSKPVNYLTDKPPF